MRSLSTSVNITMQHLSRAPLKKDVYLSERVVSLDFKEVLRFHNKKQNITMILFIKFAF